MRGGFYHGIHEIEADLAQAYRGHHQYDCVRPRRTWLDAACPVYIDFGDIRCEMRWAYIRFPRSNHQRTGSE